MTRAQLQVHLKLISNCRAKELQEKERHEKAIETIDLEWLRLVQEIAPVGARVTLVPGVKGIVLGYKKRGRLISIATSEGSTYHTRDWSLGHISVFPNKEVGE